MKTLTKHEVALLVAFSFHVQQMLQNHSEEANIIKIEFDVESGDFDVETNKKETGRRRRISKLIADVVSWANGQLDNLTFTKQLTVQKMVCHYDNGQYSIDLLVEDTTSTNATTTSDELSEN